MIRILFALMTITAALTGCNADQGPGALREAVTGDCVRIGLGKDDTWETAECGSDQGEKYKVVATFDTDDADACRGQADSDRGMRLLTGDPRTVCLRWLPRAGECLNTGYGTYHACAAGGGHKVTSTHPGSQDRQLCKTGRARVYQADRQVVCLGPNTT